MFCYAIGAYSAAICTMDGGGGDEEQLHLIKRIEWCVFHAISFFSHSLTTDDRRQYTDDNNSANLL